MKILYTANIGGYDSLKPINDLGPDWRAIYITDGEAPQGWERLGVEPSNIPDVAVAKYHKIFPPDAELTVWMDANLTPRGPLDSLVEEYPGEFVTLTHPCQHSFYQEIEVCKKHPRGYLSGKQELLEAIRLTAKERGIPDKDGNVVENRVVIRRPSARLKELQDLWWSEIEKPFGCLEPIWRDQIALRVAAYQLGYKVSTGLDYTRWFRREKHLK